jgi:hypothetical protein
VCGGRPSQLKGACGVAAAIKGKWLLYTGDQGEMVAPGDHLATISP